jgi:hypothetical protein
MIGAKATAAVSELKTLDKKWPIAVAAWTISAKIR